jgi:hypothetical protein
MDFLDEIARLVRISLVTASQPFDRRTKGSGSFGVQVFPCRPIHPVTHSLKVVAPRHNF